MKRKINLFFILYLAQQCNGFVYELNDTQYYSMPPIFKMDLYEKCLLKPNGIYCHVPFVLVSDAQSDLLDMIKAYSSHYVTHFNHTKLRHGICVSERCPQIRHDINIQDQKSTLEACLNETYWNTYRLKTRIIEPLSCNTDSASKLTVGEILAALLFLAVVFLNVAGAFCDMFTIESDNALLKCFSIKRHLGRLFTTYQRDGDEERLKCLDGLRNVEITRLYPKIIFQWLLSETANISLQAYENILNYIFLNGTLLVQVFFIMAGVLLAYKIEDLRAQGKVTWKLIPLGILQLLIRVIPSYGFVLLYTSTWIKYLGSGPLWQANVVFEADTCSSYWWAHLLFVNNYFDGSICMLQTWFLASYVQLMVFGFFICVLARSTSAKIWTLSILLILGSIAPAAHTFYHNLDPVLMVAPELPFVYNDFQTFNHVYKKGHTNTPCFIMGIALGYYIHYCLKHKVNLKKFERYQTLFNLPVPINVTMMCIGFLFKDKSTPFYINVLYAGLMKPIYGVCVCSLIFGAVFKMEHYFRTLLELDIWRVPAKLSYIAYILHMFIIRIMVGSETSLHTVNILSLFQIGFGMCVLVYLMSVLFWVLIEGPINELINNALSKERIKTQMTSVDINNKKAE
ncbi:unnamed protein product [Leptosia nina]|uniref:Acyltransferase 3 domain-containing protein n=1 Tax=Leptosia nina TaxID=320188 RepID=A0AAV1JVT2_9NEOP